MSNIEVYGVAYHSPIILWQLIHPRKYNAILLVNPQATQLKEDVTNQLVKKDSRISVVLAGSLDIAKMFLKLFPKLECKLLLFDCPGLLNPFVGPHLRWLDCDHQAGGAWQIAKIKPEDFSDLLNELVPLSAEGRRFVMEMKRQGSDKLEDIKKFADSIPKYYKDLLVSMDQDHNKSPIKLLKESRRTKETLSTLLEASLTQVSVENRNKLSKLVLDYQVGLVGKREYLSKLTNFVSDDIVKKDFLSLRKWIDSRNGALLQGAYYDLVANYQHQTQQAVLSTHKKVAEEDLQMLVAHYSPEEALLTLKEKISSYQSTSDKVV